MDDSTQPVPTSVYLYLDANEILLYVGITSRATRRQHEHNADKEWWPYVATQRVEHYKTRREAAKRERELILRHRPPFNKQHNPDHAAIREIYLTAAHNLASLRTPIVPAQVAFEDCRGKIPLTQIEAGNTATFIAGEAFRDLLRASTIPFGVRPLLLAPRKRGHLVSVDPNAELPTLVFLNPRGGIPALSKVRLHVKLEEREPFRVRIHEARGES